MSEQSQPEPERAADKPKPEGIIETIKEAVSPTPAPTPVETPKIADVSDITAIVHRDGCGHCDALKTHLREKGVLDKIKEINTDTEEGRKIADELGIKGVPECIIISSDGKKRLCTDDEWKNLVK